MQNYHCCLNTTIFCTPILLLSIVSILDSKYDCQSQSKSNEVLIGKFRGPVQNEKVRALLQFWFFRNNNYKNALTFSWLVDIKMSFKKGANRSSVIRIPGNGSAGDLREMICIRRIVSYRRSAAANLTDLTCRPIIIHLISVLKITLGYDVLKSHKTIGFHFTTG